MHTLKTAPTIRTQVVVIGAGIAGSWLALKLARAGVDTLMIHYTGSDRGGVIGSSARSVGAVNTSPMDRPDFRAFMDELGQGQHHPSVVDLLLQYLPEELDELLALGDFKKIKLGVALANGNAGSLVRRLHDEFRAAGGRMLDTWVTRIVADEKTCRGVQYQRGDVLGKVLTSVIVVASGGYTGLFDGSVKTNNYGTVLGQFLCSGGAATNLEFIFKHGYGKPDLGALTPTEELPGAEVYGKDGVHVEWLERELYEGRGTANHLEAFKHWRSNKEMDFFIDLKFHDVYMKVQCINAAIGDVGAESDRVDTAVHDLMQLCPFEERIALERTLKPWVQARERIDYTRFKEIKPRFSSIAAGEVFRVRQIAYFSMGGIGHVNGTTNLANVFVTGEAMHDFGAHRVGGLPWGLYLSLSRFLSERLIDLLGAGRFTATRDFDLIGVYAHFDQSLLAEIRTGLYQHQERNLNTSEAMEFIAWIRNKRRELIDAGLSLDDAVAWLVVAEAIMLASLIRTESRGCFYRHDHPAAQDELRGYFSCTHYDQYPNTVKAKLVPVAELSDVVFPRLDIETYQTAELARHER